MTLLNLAPANYTDKSFLLSSNVGKVDNIGNNGTVCNTIAAEGKYVNSPGKVDQMIGGNGYGFTDKFPGKIIGPDAGYLGVNTYENSGVPRAGNVDALWENLTGGKRRRYRQVGCKKTGGRRRSHRHNHKCTHRRNKRKHSSKRSSKHSSKRSSKHSSKHSSKRKHSIKRKHSSRRKYRGGNGQPYSNIPQSFGQSFDSKLSPYDSALASPVPMTPYSRCESF
jgi:hypothetical protein